MKEGIHIMNPKKQNKVHVESPKYKMSCQT